MINRIRSLGFILILMSSAALAGEPQNFVGTWLTTVTPPAEAGVPPFTLLLTLHGDGTLLASGTSGDFPALGNPCHGSWSGSGASVQAAYICLDFDGSLQQTGMDRPAAVFNLDEKRQLAGKIGLTNYDVLGQRVFDACCATVAGQRIEIDDAKPLEPNHQSVWRSPR
ncbi:MAG TPA: hypothetical protein VG323_03180 [Thermoanaerobaculia bacterium]|nr:hypothetical protein [Thermoanaerobaculia bacterium]